MRPPSLDWRRRNCSEQSRLRKVGCGCWMRWKLEVGTARKRLCPMWFEHCSGRLNRMKVRKRTSAGQSSICTPLLITWMCDAHAVLLLLLSQVLSSARLAAPDIRGQRVVPSRSTLPSLAVHPDNAPSRHQSLSSFFCTRNAFNRAYMPCTYEITSFKKQHETVIKQSCKSIGLHLYI